MTKNLFDLTYELATELGVVYESAVTASTSTKAITDDVMRTEAADYWNQGTVWITYDAGAAAAAPQGEYAVVDDFDATNDTILLATALSTSCVATDEYAVAHKVFPLYDLILAVNRAIRDVGYIPVTNDTAIETAAAQTEYDLPIEANHDLREVWIETNTADADDNQWINISRDCYIQHTDVGTADKLVFNEQPAYPRDVKLVYMSPHVKLRIYTDELSESVPYERVIYKAAVHALKHYRMKTRSDDDYLLDSIRDYEARSEKADLMYPIKAPKKLGKMLSLGRTKTRELAPGENKI